MPSYVKPMLESWNGVKENQQIFEWFGMSFMVHSEGKKISGRLSESNYLFLTSSLS